MDIFWVLRFCEYFFFFVGGGGGGGGGHHNIGLYLRAISMHFRVFLRSMYRMGNILLFLFAKI